MGMAVLEGGGGAERPSRPHNPFPRSYVDAECQPRFWGRRAGRAGVPAVHEGVGDGKGLHARGWSGFGEGFGWGWGWASGGALAADARLRHPKPCHPKRPAHPSWHPPESRAPPPPGRRQGHHKPAQPAHAPARPLAGAGPTGVKCRCRRSERRGRGWHPRRPKGVCVGGLRAVNDECYVQSDIQMSSAVAG